MDVVLVAVAVCSTVSVEVLLMVETQLEGGVPKYMPCDPMPENAHRPTWSYKRQ